MKSFLCFLLLVLLFVGCHSGPSLQKDVQSFLDSYSKRYVDLSYEADKADWKSNTMIVEGDTTNAYATRLAREALARFTGSKENIDKARRYLEEEDKLKRIQVKQLQKILYLAADNPQTVPELVKKRIKAETEQNEKLYGFDFKIDGRSVTTNEIDAILKRENDLNGRFKAWEASKEVGKTLREGLDDLKELRNQTVQALGYQDYFSYQISDYGISTEKMMELMMELNRQVRPLYRELHTYARYTLAKRYGVNKVPDMLPADWLPNRWGQDWTPMVVVEGLDLDGALKDKKTSWLVEQAERFYVSLGFPKLPESFWKLSSLYPLPKDAGYKKNNHASAWHLDLNRDVRCLMSIVPNAEWYETTHHELGHIYYFLTYSNPNVPVLLRAGANRAFHEGVGSLMGLAAMQEPFIDHIGLLAKNSDTNKMQALLKEALNFIVFIPWSAGVMTEFEYDLYANNLPRDEFNKKWWELKRKYQGIVPPEARGEEFCDAASKTHINNDPAQYYDYALSYVLLFQLHDHIAREILKEDPHATKYFDSKEVGRFLYDIMYPGGSEDWSKLLMEKTNEELSAEPMLRYFAPLLDYLKKLNIGRKHTLQDI